MNRAEERASEGTAGEARLSDRHEPALLRYFRLLWGHRLLIVCGSLAPALLLGVVLYLWPKDYTVTFVYERPLTESEYNVLLRRFYSSENLEKIIGQLRENSALGYARKLEEATTEEALGRLIRFTASPAYPRRLQTTDPDTSERISAFEARLLYVFITGDSKEEMAGVSAAVTANVENMLPIYEVRNALKGAIQEYKVLAAEIEDNRFALSVELQEEKKKLEKLMGLAETPTASEGNVVLEFTDIQESREFLPLPYQVRAIQSKIINLEETLDSDQQKYTYYLKIIDLNDRLLGVIEASILTPYTVAQFLDYLGGQLRECKDEALADYLKSYIRKTQNLILVNTRAGEKPVVYPVPKRIASRATLAFFVGLMVSAFTAVALEYRRGRHDPLHPRHA
ncbi:MAG: hypothetical protein JW993_15140 [Sedimentisphaerales bacterium]|nr:hypothetical protein [Sedimentisphaerales bacterium]